MSRAFFDLAQVLNHALSCGIESCTAVLDADDVAFEEEDGTLATAITFAERFVDRHGMGADFFHARGIVLGGGLVACAFFPLHDVFTF